MTNETQKPHFSQSQLESFCRCPEAYRRRYLEGDRIPPGFSMLKGTAVHGGAQVNLSQKIESHRDLPASDIVDASVAKFDEAIEDGVTLTEDEASAGLKATRGRALDDIVEMAEVHATTQSPDYQPILVEESIRIELKNAPRDLLGVLDVADDRDIVADFKTAGKSKSQADADDSVQLTVYACAFRVKTGRDAKELRLDTIVQTKTKTKRQVVSTTRGPRDFNALAARINAVQKTIDAGNFPPATPGAWWCSSKWCGYHRTCAYVNSEPYQLVQLDAASK